MSHKNFATVRMLQDKSTQYRIEAGIQDAKLIDLFAQALETIKQSRQLVEQSRQLEVRVADINVWVGAADNKFKQIDTRLNTLELAVFI